MSQERLAPENPESLRTQVIENLLKYQIRPEGLVIPGLSYGSDYIEFIHQCHDLGNRLMRVKEDEVYIEGAGLTFEDKKTMGPGLVRIDDVDKWEAFAGYTVAMLYDPRWLLARLKDLKLTHKETSKELKGNLYPYEHGIMSLGSLRRDVERKSKEELIQELRASTETDIPQSEEEVRETVIKEATKPWEFLIEIDQRNLPISITPNEDLTVFIPEENGGGVRFNYVELPTQ